MALEPVRAFSFDQMMAEPETFLEIQSVFSTGFCQNDCILPNSVSFPDKAPLESRRKPLLLSHEEIPI